MNGVDDMHEKIFQRHESNPILTIDDLPVNRRYLPLAVFNPGVVEMDGEVVLLLRVEAEDGRSSIYVARSRDGVSNWRIESSPLLAPDDPDSPIAEYESNGCEDARVTYIAELDAWFIAYVAASDAGPAVALARTNDFQSVERLGLVMPPANKDAALFPQRIGDKWIMLHRPVSGHIEHIWLAESSDLIHWGHPKIVLRERGGTWWDGFRVGAGAVPIETPHGWLLIYHGVKLVAGVPCYRLGLALVDLENPARVISRCLHPILSPTEPYERIGNGLNIVFTCGALVRGDEVWLYYGAADTCVALAIAKLDDLIQTALAYAQM